MGQRQADREWPKPRNTRHVWVIGYGRHTPPVQGFVVAWSRHSYKWSALVVYIEPLGEAQQMVQRWLPLDRLRPVRSDPNQILRYWGFSELGRPKRSQ